jgi:hypothetical protein
MWAEPALLVLAQRLGLKALISNDLSRLHLHVLRSAADDQQAA